MTKGIFITATGTDVGKTYISALLVKIMRNFGFNCGYYKPVLSGAEYIDGNLIPGDCEYVKNFAGLEEPAMNYLSYCFKPAVSPHLAAQIENNPIKLSKIKSDFEIIKKKYEYLVVEGAGGIVCPLDLSNDRPFLTEDIIKGLGLDVLMVTTSLLGSINSAVTSIEYAKAHGINVRGIILNNFDDSDFMQNDNKFQIQKLSGIPVIAAVKFGDKNINIDKTVLEKIFVEI